MNKSEHLQWLGNNLPFIEQFIATYGQDAFLVATFYGAWNEGLWQFLHPYNELLQSPVFPLMQQAAIDLYV
jgi:hypothetical protein